MDAREADLLETVKEVVRDQIIHGTYQYEKEPTLTGAMDENSSAYFGPWSGVGHIFYKVRKNVVAPRHFQGSGDVGTITVRYILEAVSPFRTRLRIVAVFVETARRIAHSSDGTVENSEFKVIEEHLKAIQVRAKEAAEARAKRAKEEASQELLNRRREEEARRLAEAESALQELQQRVRDLREKVEMRVKETGAALKSAPFHGAVTLEHLRANAEILILVVTPYWYGVETVDGKHGWVQMGQLEPLP